MAGRLTIKSVQRNLDEEYFFIREDDLEKFDLKELQSEPRYYKTVKKKILSKIYLTQFWIIIIV